MIPANEHLRYDYPLTAKSTIMDIGAYQGNFSRHFAERVACRICAFEPVSEFYYVAQKQVAAFPCVELYHFGLGATDRVEDFGVQNDSSGKFATSALRQNVTLCSIERTMKLLGLSDVDLAKINIEGGEFELLAEIIRLGWASRFRNPWQTIHEALSETHGRTWGGDFTYWTNYKLIG
ncbi:FkbM family methyltransferase [Candidatus Parcubacteria bacterium]|nr:FkbM family methyltransferase [Candidatus Parcubacteria bacterium]